VAIVFTAPAARTASTAVGRAILAVAMLAATTFAGEASADEATRWLERAARAAKTLNYAGTIVFQHNGHVDTSRLVHMVEGGQEQEKLLSLDGPAREVIRSSAEVRCYFPDAKVIRIEPRTFRNVFPSLSAEQLRNLGQYYEARMTVSERVAGHWDAGHVLRAQGRFALCAQILGRGEYRPSAQGPRDRRSRRSRRAVHVYGRKHQ
jgi:negative regulator of sigma E activity